MPQPHAHALPTLLLLVLPACSSPEPESFSEPVCGEPGPKRLLELPPDETYEIVGLIDDRVIVQVSDGGTVHVVGSCGEDPSTFEAEGSLQIWGDWVLSRVLNELVYHDVRTGEQHLLLTGADPNLIATPHGLLALSRAGGPLLLHPDPSDPAAEPVTLLPQTADLDDRDTGGFYLHDHWSDGTRTFGLDPAGTLYRFDLSNIAAPEPVVTGVTGYNVVDDGAQLLYERDQVVFLRDLETGDELELPGPLGASPYDEANGWILTGAGLVHLERHEILDIPGLQYGYYFQNIHPAGDGSIIGIEPSSNGFDLGGDSDFWRIQDDGSAEKLVDHLCSIQLLGAERIVYPDGVVLPSRCLEDRSRYNDRPQDIMFFPLEGEPYDVGRSLGTHWLVSEHLISVEWDLPHRLLIDPPDEAPQVAAYQVRAMTVPVAGEDLFYVAGGGLFRASLGL